MANLEAVARRQAASRSKYLYSQPAPPTPSVPQDRSILAQPTSRLAPRETLVQRSPRTVFTRNTRFTPYSLTPHISNYGTLFSQDTTDRLLRAMDRGLAKRTQQNYSSHVRQFIRFCEAERVAPSSIFPASELLLCAFVGSFVGEKSGRTASAAISALKSWHRLHGKEWLGGYLLSHVLKGAASLAPASSLRPPRPPVTLAMLHLLRSNLNLRDPFDSAVFAAALTALWGQCRLGELLGSSRRLHDPLAYPSRSSLKLCSGLSQDGSDTSAVLHLPRTKTHQLSGESISLTPQRDSLSPISALCHHFRINAAVAPSRHLFSYQSNDGITRCLTREDFLARCNAVWSAAGIIHISGHSFRIGGTHVYLSSGVPSDVVKKMGRWSSDAFLGYWRSLHSIVELHAKNISVTAPLQPPPAKHAQRHRSRRTSTRP
ncbi:hypothetical protein RSAG8_13544, partial [Rhizoctonia solani AG-8 WAC10335]